MNSEIEKYGNDILQDAEYNTLRNFVQHKHSNTYKHCVSVADKCIRIADRLHLKIDKSTMVRGSLLHDYYLYDWHIERTHFHGFTHPKLALENAGRRFTLNKREREIIKKHMWPLTVIPPLCLEAWIIVLADKIVTVNEVLGRI
ncbi:MAG: HD domain-containing protein [Lachnospiraceae bacterium]|nr:HD domain-containing protein [Lachnospiraceae bacterium]